MDIRVIQPQVKLQTLFKLLNLNRKTYYDNKNKRLNKPDKYARVKEGIKSIYYGDEGRETYDYCPMWGALYYEDLSCSINSTQINANVRYQDYFISYINTGEYSFL